MSQGTKLLLEGHEIQPLRHSLFWFRWRGRSFDIRYLREAVGLPALMLGDAITLPTRSPIEPLIALEAVLSRAANQPFDELLDEHDRLLPVGIEPPSPPRHVLPA